MPEDFLTGIRDPRSSILSGAILIASIYVLALRNDNPAISLSPSAQYILKFNDSVPLAIAAVFIYLVGSLYMTALEGVVDLIHRRLLYSPTEINNSRLRRIFLDAFGPLSGASRSRLLMEADRFYEEMDKHLSTTVVKEPKDVFVRRVLADVLWMEGKLTGTSLGTTYSEYRGEGEFRLGTGLLLPLGAVAVAYATQLNWHWLTLIVTSTTIVAIQTCNYGLYYFRRAHSLLAHHVADGILLTPSMETLKRMAKIDASPPP